MKPWYRTPLDFAGRQECIMSILWAYLTQILYQIKLGFLATRRVDTKPFNRIPSDYFPPVTRFSTEVWVCVLSMLYNAVFMAAWRFQFPSVAEQTIWQAASILTLVCGFLGALLGAYIDHAVFPFKSARVLRSRTTDQTGTSSDTWLYRQMNMLINKLKQPRHRAGKRQGAAAVIERNRREDSPENQIPSSQRQPQTDPAACEPKKGIHRIVAAMRNNSPENDPTLAIPLRVILPVTFLCALYSLSRFYILVEDVIGLRRLPASAFETVDWSRYVPHI